MIDWQTVYSKDEVVGKKFERLQAPIPWTSDYEQNVVDTLEWLMRSGKKEAIRYEMDHFFSHTTDRWYRCELEEGYFAHVCYPQDMLKFRQRYDGLYEAVDSNNDLKGAMERIGLARRVLWSAWRCYGHDGARIRPEGDDMGLGNEYTFKESFGADVPYKYWKQHWDWRCSRCQEELPKQLRMAVYLQVKLKDAM